MGLGHGFDYMLISKWSLWKKGKRKGTKKELRKAVLFRQQKQNKGILIGRW